ncbi:hypothetical protein ACFY8O_17110 [Streptomyces argenteolus]|uniref:Uncharacterized protein n=1 Tax=Streptomyces argenteolus TaxID=67274 RepID=A0ABW6X6B4_9ACTN
MDMEALSADDYESVHRASRGLAARYGMVTLNAMMEAWEALVQDVEEGFDAEQVWEYGTCFVAAGGWRRHGLCSRTGFGP